MLMLSLLRHAKSSWDEPLDDFERPLAKRGIKAASDMGAYLAGESLRPDLVLCSGAVRTRATLALVFSALGPPAPEVIHDDALYLAMPSLLLGRVRRIEGRASHTLIIGHNPGLHGLALDLVGEGEGEDITALATKFPTAALAVITFEVARWSAVKPGGGRLARFVTPRRLGHGS